MSSTKRLTFSLASNKQPAIDCLPLALIFSYLDVWWWLPFAWVSKYVASTLLWLLSHAAGDSISAQKRLHFLLLAHVLHLFKASAMMSDLALVIIKQAVADGNLLIAQLVSQSLSGGVGNSTLCDAGSSLFSTACRGGHLATAQWILTIHYLTDEGDRTQLPSVYDLSDAIGRADYSMAEWLVFFSGFDMTEVFLDRCYSGPPAALAWIVETYEHVAAAVLSDPQVYKKALNRVGNSEDMTLLRWFYDIFGYDIVDGREHFLQACSTGSVAFAEQICERFRITKTDVIAVLDRFLNSQHEYHHYEEIVRWLVTRFRLTSEIMQPYLKTLFDLGIVEFEGCPPAYYAYLRWVSDTLDAESPPQKIFRDACHYNHPAWARSTAERFSLTAASFPTEELVEMFTTACEREQSAVAKLIYQHFGIARSAVVERKPLIFGSHHDGLEVFKWFVGEFQLTSDEIRSSDNCILHDCCYEGEFETVQYLVETFQIATTDAGTFRAFYQACSHCDLKIAQWLATQLSLSETIIDCAEFKEIIPHIVEDYYRPEKKFATIRWLFETFSLARVCLTVDDIKTMFDKSFSGTSTADIYLWLLSQAEVSTDDQKHTAAVIEHRIRYGQKRATIVGVKRPPLYCSEE